MSEVLDLYLREAASGLSTIPWLLALQKKGVADLLEQGFPTKHLEDWKYTSVDAFLKQHFKCCSTSGGAHYSSSRGACDEGSPALAVSNIQEIPHCVRDDVSVVRDDVSAGRKNLITITNGEIHITSELTNTLPAGVLIKPLSVMLREHEDLVRPYLGQLLAHGNSLGTSSRGACDEGSPVVALSSLQEIPRAAKDDVEDAHEHGFQALNTAMLELGLVIYLPKDAHLDEPLLVQHSQDKTNQAVYLRHLIIAEAGSCATIVEDYTGEANTVYCTNAITEIFLAERAKINHYNIQQESRTAFHLRQVVAKQQESSEFFSHSLSLGGQLVRSDIRIDLQGKNASCLMNGVYIPGENQHIDHHTRVNHSVPDCFSEQDYKGILQKRSRAVFNGQVVVAKGAHGTRAEQQNKNILLAPDAEIDTKPQLEIFADDVLCSHGATVGQLDEEALFYLSSRGMDKALVARYLIQAFIASNMRLIDDSSLRDSMMLLINEKLGTTDYE